MQASELASAVFQTVPMDLSPGNNFFASPSAPAIKTIAKKRRRSADNLSRRSPRKCPVQYIGLFTFK